MRDDRHFLYGWRAGLRWLLAILGMLGICEAALAQAFCNGAPSYRLPTLNANMHTAAVGAPISPWSVKNGSGVVCRITIAGFRAAHLGELHLSMPGRVSTYTEDGVEYDVFATNITGIGYVLGYQSRGERSRNPSNYCSQAWRSAKAGDGQNTLILRTNDPCSAIGTRSNVIGMGQAHGSAESINFSYTARVRFIRTGTTLGSGSIGSGSLGASCYREYSNRSANLNPPLSYVQISACNGTSGSDTGSVPVPAAATCTLDTAHLNRAVPMLPTRVRDFNGKGTTTVPTPVTFRVTCQNATRLSYSFTGEMAMGYPSVLRNRAGGVRSATGIGIQIVDPDNNDAAVALGTSKDVTGTINGTRDLKFAVRYFSLEDVPAAMRPGDVEAQATINLTFQ